MDNQDTPTKTHTLIISDFHLGSKVSRSRDLINFLSDFRFKKLILLGDIFESLNFNRLNETDWQLISLIGELSKKSKVIWVAGNHDLGLTGFLGSLTDIKVCNFHSWKYQGKKYLAIHGHQFDNFLVDNAVISFLANWIYNFIQIVDFKDKRISRAVKRKSKGWLRISNKVAQRAVIYARVMQADYIFCGHTHKAMELDKKEIKYYNCGCWTDESANYIILDGEEIRIMEYVNN